MAPENLDIIKTFIKDVPEEMRPMFLALIESERQSRQAICKKIDEIKIHCAAQPTVCAKNFLTRQQGVIAGLILFIVLLLVEFGVTKWRDIAMRVIDI